MLRPGARRLGGCERAEHATNAVQQRRSVESHLTSPFSLVHGRVSEEARRWKGQSVGPARFRAAIALYDKRTPGERVFEAALRASPIGGVLRGLWRCARSFASCFRESLSAMLAIGRGFRSIGERDLLMEPPGRSLEES